MPSEPPDSFSAAKGSLCFTAAAQAVSRGAVPLLGLMRRRWWGEGCSSLPPSGMAHRRTSPLPARGTEQGFAPLLVAGTILHLHSPSSPGGCTGEGQSRGAPLRALSGQHSRRAAVLLPLPLRVAACCVGALGELYAWYVTAPPADRELSSELWQPHTSFAWLMPGCFLGQTDRRHGKGLFWKTGL